MTTGMHFIVNVGGHTFVSLVLSHVDKLVLSRSKTDSLDPLSAEETVGWHAHPLARAQPEESNTNDELLLINSR